MKIYLVQPGEHESETLTQRGEWQLQTLARRLLKDKLEVDRIYVNGHNVSRESGSILSKSLKVPVISDERFREVNKEIILGDIRDHDIENMENIGLFIDEIARKGKDAIITVGGGIHRMVISKLTGMPLNETRHFSLMSSGISILEFNEKADTPKWRITTINDRNHLFAP
jgi:broad specificity phosphatase PhoE